MSVRPTIRERLADMLTVELGKPVRSEELRPQKGSWRSNVRLDVCRWEASLPAGYDGRSRPAISWETMTECLTNGIEILEDRFTVEVYALDPSKAEHRTIRDWQRFAASCLRAGKEIPAPPHVTFGMLRFAADEAARDACSKQGYS